MNILKEDIAQLLVIVGIIDTVYLINLHYASGVCVGELQTFLGFVIDCGAVASSSYSEIFGIPIAFIGFLYYLTLFVLLNFKPKIVSILEETSLGFDHIIAGILSIAFLVSIYLIYLQLGVLELICTYCMVSAFTSITIFFLLVTPTILQYMN